jgi:putative NADH-flavin reductase
MRLVVFGATGGTGREVVVQALAAGHEVTAVARRPEAFDLQHERLRVARGDVLDAASAAAAIAGHDAVASAVGPRDRGPTRIYSEGAANLVRGMRAAGVRRAVLVSAIGIDPEVDLPFPLDLVMRFAVRPMLRESYADALRMEDELRGSDLDWTIVRAPLLTKGPHTGRYRTSVATHLRHAVRISRADLADYVLALVPDASTHRAWVELAY